jgi:hypothetical protein
MEKGKRNRNRKRNRKFTVHDNSKANKMQSAECGFVTELSTPRSLRCPAEGEVYQRALRAIAALETSECASNYISRLSLASFSSCCRLFALNFCIRFFLCVSTVYGLKNNFAAICGPVKPFSSNPKISFSRLVNTG